MSIPTAAELAYFRTQPQQVDLYLSIYKPPTIWAARVNDASIAKGARIITFDSVTTSGNPVRGMTMYVGTTLGGKDKGIVYVMKPVSGSTITVSENSHIDWDDNDYLTVVNFYQIWPVYPRITVSGSYITVFMNYDEAYGTTSGTSQNIQDIVMVNMGAHHAGFLDIATQQHQVYFTNANVENLEIGSLTYSWNFEGGTPTGTAAEIPGNVTWNAPGHYTVRLAVTNTNGSYTRTFYSYRHISIYDRPGEGPDVPILKWGLESLAGSREEGGYTAKLWVEQDISDVVDGALVVLFSDEWFGNTKRVLDSDAIYRPGIVFVGYILGDTIQYDYQHSRVTFDAGSPTMVMKRAEAFGVSLEDTQNPITDAATKFGSPWYYRLGLSTRAGIYHYIYWHTTINLCTDVYAPPLAFNLSLRQSIQYFDVDRTPMYGAIQTLLRSTIYGSIVSTKQGVLILETDPSTEATELYVFYPYDTFMNLDKHDWIGEPKITERMIGDVSQLEIGAVYWTGLMPGLPGTSTPFLSIAPGTTPAYRGSPQRLSGLAVGDQTELNDKTGNIYAKMNARFPEVLVNLAGNYSLLDIAPAYFIKMTLAPSENVRGLNWVAKPFIVETINWVYENHSLRCNLILTEHTVGFPGDTVTL